MEKKDRQISIILNGKEKSFEKLKQDKRVYEQLRNSEIAATNEENSNGADFPWQLSESMPKRPSPKVIDLGERRRDKQKSAAPYCDDGKSDEAPKLPAIKRKKKHRLDFNVKDLPLRLLGIIIAAIIVGTSFGLMMLTIFSDDNGEPDSALNTGESQSVTGGSMVAAIPTLAVEVVQGGAFSLVAKGQEMAQIIKDNGFAAVLTNTTDPVHLLIGVGLDNEQATVISEKHQANGQPVYMKPYAVTTSGTVATENQTLFLQAGVELYQDLTLLSVNAIANGGSLLTAETMAKLTTTFQNFQAIKESFGENEQQQQLADVFQAELDKSHQQLQSFASTKDDASLWQVQQFLLNGLIAYEELINTFKKD